MALHVLRKIKRATLAELQNDDPKHFADWLYLDKNREWFEKGYVDADHPRPAEVTQQLIDNTTEFVVWADDEGAVATYEDYLGADFARRNAKITLGVEIKVPEEPVVAARKGKADAVESGTAAAG